MPNPLVSVIVLAYDHEPFLGDALDGIVAQRVDFPIEIIVGEDCSKDGTLAVAERYRAQYPDLIQIVTSPDNVGAIRNLHRCVAAARGEFIAFCEGDDWWTDPDKLAKQVQLMTPDVGLVHADVAIARPLAGPGWHVDRVSVHSGRDPATLQGEMFASVIRGLYVGTCTTLYRRIVIEQALQTRLGDPHHVLFDFSAAAFCAASWRIAYLEEVVAVYRQNPASATHGSFAKKVAFLRGSVAVYGELERLFGNRADFDPKAVGWAHEGLAKAAFLALDAAALSEALAGLRISRPGAARSPAMLLRRLLASVPPVQAVVVGWWNRRQERRATERAAQEAEVEAAVRARFGYFPNYPPARPGAADGFGRI